MAVSKLENIWQIMRNVNYEIVTEIDHEMMCLLCKKLLINAHCAPCGCRFCFTCISGYMEGENKICPGNTDDCKIEMINFDENISIDNAINNKISKLKVKCLEKTCKFVDELRKIEDHVRMCNYRSIECPFSNIGCDKLKISSDKIAEHMQSEILRHTELLRDFLDNINNEINISKLKIGQLNSENQLLKEKINELERKCDNEQLEIEFLRDVNREITNTLEELKLTVEINQVDIRQLESKSDNEQRKNAEKELMRKNDCERISCQIDEIIQNVDKKLSEMVANQNKLDCSEFVWKLDRFSDKMADAKNGNNTEIYSESFSNQNNGYKMCLCVYPGVIVLHKSSHLSVFFCLMKGEFDDILEWPFRHSVTIALINQRTRLPHVSHTLSYENYPNSKAFIKPTNINNGWGCNLISLSELLANSDLIMKNQIFIKCTVQIQS